MSNQRYYNRGKRTSRSPQSNRSRSGRGRKSNYFLPRGTMVYILDRLKHGGIDREKHGWNPICQVIKSPSCELFEIEYAKDAEIKIQERVEIKGKESNILGRVSRKIQYKDLTPTASEMLEPVLMKMIKDNEKKYVEWINKAGPITIRRHYLELLPGVGKKLMNKILEERRIKEFESIGDLNERIHGFNPVKAIAQRILREFEDDEVKHHIFIRKKQKQEQDSRSGARQRRPNYQKGRNPNRRY